MIARVRLKTVKKTKALNRASLFGPAPVLKGENSGAYDELLARVSGDVKASDIFEEIWIRDIADLTWEIWRYRRLKMSLIASEMEGALSDILSPFIDPPEEDQFSDSETEDVIDPSEVEEGADPAETKDEDWIPPARKLAAAWAARDPDALKQIDELLSSVGLTMDSVIARALERELDNIERIERLITVAEARRNATLREIDYHRATLAETMRRKLQDADDAEFVIVKPSKTIGPKKRTSRDAT